MDALVAKTTFQMIERPLGYFGVQTIPAGLFGLRSNQQSLLPRSRSICELYVFADQIPIEVQEKSFRLLGNRRKYNRVRTHQGKSVSDRFPLDIGKKKLASLSRCESCNVICAEVV